MLGVQVQYLVRELTSHMPGVGDGGAKNENIKQKRYCCEFNKDFKNDPYQKILKKKKNFFLTYLNYPLSVAKRTNI